MLEFRSILMFEGHKVFLWYFYLTNFYLLMRNEYILKRKSGLAREKAYVEGCAGKPAPQCRFTKNS